MSHDPFCPWNKADKGDLDCNGKPWPNCGCKCSHYDFGPCDYCVEQSCQCEIIVTVREDERQSRKSLDTPLPHAEHQYGEDSCAYCVGYADGAQEAAAK